MAHSKKFLFTEQEQLTADFCKAIAHPARLRILHQLRGGWVLTANELNRDIPLAVPTLQNHLNMLQRIQLIELAQSQECSAGYRLVEDVYNDFLEVLREEVVG